MGSAFTATDANRTAAADIIIVRMENMLEIGLYWTRKILSGESMDLKIDNILER